MRFANELLTEQFGLVLKTPTVTGAQIRRHERVSIVVWHSGGLNRGLASFERPKS